MSCRLDMNEINATFEQFFIFEKALNALLDDENFDAFSEQQAHFQNQLEAFLKGCSAQQLEQQVVHIERLASLVEQLHQRAERETKKLKDQSLALQRNKKKINAYK